jgi:cardiolipin synthase
LDPLADKLLLTMVYILGVQYGIPLYVTVLVLSRDFLIVLGWVLLHYFDRNAEIRPIWISKLNTACQFIMAILVLLNIALSKEGGVPDVALQGALAVTVITTLASGGAYFAVWYKRMGGFTRV